MEPTDNPSIEHSVTHAHNLLDKLAQLVGQDRATTAVKWVDEVKQHLADAVKAAGETIAEVTDPAVFAEIEQLKQTILNRDATIAQDQAHFRVLCNTDGSDPDRPILDVETGEMMFAAKNAPAPSTLAEVIESEIITPPAEAETTTTGTTAPIEEF